MKARKLKSILNNTAYHVHKQGNKVCVGSPMCSDLISVDMATMRVRCALDTFNTGRKSLGQNGELLFIYDKLEELAKSGELIEIFNGVDEVETPLPVYYAKDGAVVETFTDAHGWPNVTIEGDMMYVNTHFDTPEKAVEKAISESTSECKFLEEKIAEKESELLEFRAMFDKAIAELKSYQGLMPKNTGKIFA